MENLLFLGVPILKHIRVFLPIHAVDKVCTFIRTVDKVFSIFFINLGCLLYGALVSYFLWTNSLKKNTINRGTIYSALSAQIQHHYKCFY